jgi:putative addiction module component (TIGR02574 family)
MTELAQTILQQALTLSPLDRSVLIDALVASLDQADSRLDELWVREAGDRLTAYRAGELTAVSAESVFEELETL